MAILSNSEKINTKYWIVFTVEPFEKRCDNFDAEFIIQIELVVIYNRVVFYVWTRSFVYTLKTLITKLFFPVLYQFGYDYFVLLEDLQNTVPWSWHCTTASCGYQPLLPKCLFLTSNAVAVCGN